MPENVVVYAIRRRYATKDSPDWQWAVIDAAIVPSLAETLIERDMSLARWIGRTYSREDYDIVECVPIVRQR